MALVSQQVWDSNGRAQEMSSSEGRIKVWLSIKLIFVLLLFFLFYFTPNLYYTVSKIIQIQALCDDSKMACNTYNYQRRHKDWSGLSKN